MKFDKETIIAEEIKNSGIIKDIREVLFLDRGGFADVFLLKTGNDSYILKLRRDEEYQRLQREYGLLSNKELAEKDLAPKAIEFDKSLTFLKYPYLIEEYVEGTHPDKSDIDDSFIAKMAKWYRDLHSIKTDVLEESERDKINSILSWARENFDKFRTFMIADEKIASDCALFYGSLLKIAEGEDRILSRDNYDLIQCDPSPENVFMQGNGNIKLIDWDFAGFHLFERDLALFIDIFNLNGRQKEFFINEYGVNPREIIKRLDILQLILSSGDINWLLEERNGDKDKIRKILDKAFLIIDNLKD